MTHLIHVTLTKKGVHSLLGCIVMVTDTGTTDVLFTFSATLNTSGKGLTASGFLQLNADIYESDPELQQIRKDRGYSYMDIITIHKDTLPNYEEKVTHAL